MSGLPHFFRIERAACPQWVRVFIQQPTVRLTANELREAATQLTQAAEDLDALNEVKK
jgi:hypothetical protein